MVELEKLFKTILNITISSNNKDVDVLEIGASPEEVVYLLVHMRNEYGINIEKFVGNFPITFNLLSRCINETSYSN